jgi:enterochelin esterase family protein
VGKGYGFTDGACNDSAGNFYFSDLPKGTLYRVPPGGDPEIWLENGLKVSGMKFGPDGRLYAATQGAVETKEPKKIVAIDPVTKAVTVIATQVEPNDLVVSRRGWLYFTVTGAGQVQRVPIKARSMARPQTAAGGIVKPNGISLSADQNFLIVSEYGGTNVWSFAINEDGSLRSGERYMTLRTPVGRADSGGDGMTTDADSRYYITSFMGIQMFDKTGRMGGVIDKPDDGPCVSVVLAGPDMAWLYACSKDKVWRRFTKARGIVFYE